MICNADFILVSCSWKLSFQRSLVLELCSEKFIMIFFIRFILFLFTKVKNVLDNIIFHHFFSLLSLPFIFFLQNFDLQFQIFQIFFFFLYDCVELLRFFFK